MDFLLVIIAIGFGFASLLVSINNKPPIRYTNFKPTKSKTLFKKPKSVDPKIKETKSMLVDMGYTTTEAKGLLDGIQADTVADYISKAMDRVEI